MGSTGYRAAKIEGERESMKFEDIQHIPVGRLLGAKVRYRGIWTNRIRSGKIVHISRRKASFDRPNGDYCTLDWREIVSLEPLEEEIF